MVTHFVGKFHIFRPPRFRLGPFSRINANGGKEGGAGRAVDAEQLSPEGGTLHG